MATRKQSGGALLVGVLVLIAIIPKQIWIVIGLLALLAGVAYVIIRWQCSQSLAPAQEQEHQPTLAELTRPPKPARLVAHAAAESTQAVPSLSLSDLSDLSEPATAPSQPPHPTFRLPGSQAGGTVPHVPPPAQLSPISASVAGSKDDAQTAPKAALEPSATSPAFPGIDRGNLAAAKKAISDRPAAVQALKQTTAPSAIVTASNLGNLSAAQRAITHRHPMPDCTSPEAQLAIPPAIVVPSFDRPQSEPFRSQRVAERTGSSPQPNLEGHSPQKPPPIPQVTAPTMPQEAKQHDEELHRVTAAAEEQRKFTVPTPPEGWAKTRWLSPQDSIEIVGVTIGGGLFYTGTKLPTKYSGNDPSLINPVLAVAPTGLLRDAGVSYKQSYVELSPPERRAYLDWLASGRTEAGTCFTFVHLYFCGLERRVMVDGASDPSSKKDWPAIKLALRRLYAVSGPVYPSLTGPVQSLLDWMELDAAPEKLYTLPLPAYERGLDVPFYIRLALGQCSVDRAPIPGALALTWARLNPSISIRTAATRCATEFDKLFLERYRELFGAGMVLAKNKTKLKFVRAPYSPGLYGTAPATRTFGEIPDVTALRAPLNTLATLVGQCAQELSAFSRLIGKNPEARQSLDGWLLLPVSIWPDSAQCILSRLRAEVETASVTHTLGDLIKQIGGTSLSLGREKVRDLARALESAHIGMEPNVLEGARVPGAADPVVLFAMLPDQTHQADSEAFQTAQLTLQLASTVAHSDGAFSEQELAHLSREIDGWSHLSAADHRRLRAHLQLLEAAPVTLASLKKRLDPVGQGAKERIAADMANLAQVDGVVSPDEVRFLEKVYKALGVEPKRVFSDVHSPSSSQTNYAPTPAGGFRLDPERVAALQRDTAKVSALLANIFTEDTPEPVGPPASIVTSAPPSTTGLLGLDEAHSSLLRLMLTRPTWSRAELQDSASDLELMLDGALEQINDASFDAYDLPFSDDDDPLEINPEFLENFEQ